MKQSKAKPNQNLSASEILLNGLIPSLLDPQAKDLAKQVEWWKISGLNPNPNAKVFPKEYPELSKLSDNYPVAIAGKGSPLLLLHGFDSCFLEFRRLVPLLESHHKLVIPDLFGFGFCPRHKDAKYGPKLIIKHLGKILDNLECNTPIGLIGASMGGAIAMELARLHPEKINRILLLSPAGLTGKKMPIPRPLDKIGVWFLSRPEVRKSLCRQAFSKPNESVGEPEKQIASIHLEVPGWNSSLATFARSGGIAGFGDPIPPQPLHAIWGANDRIIQGRQKIDALKLLGSCSEEINDCGHLPHLDQPEVVAQRWIKGF